MPNHIHGMQLRKANQLINLRAVSAGIVVDCKVEVGEIAVPVRRMTRN